MLARPFNELKPSCMNKPDFGSFQVLKIVGCPAAHFFWLIFLILLYRLVIDAL